MAAGHPGSQRFREGVRAGVPFAIAGGTVAVAVGGLLYWRTESIIGCGLLSAALTAALRAL